MFIKSILTFKHSSVPLAKSVFVDYDRILFIRGSFSSRFLVLNIQFFTSLICNRVRLPCMDPLCKRELKTQVVASCCSSGFFCSFYYDKYLIYAVCIYVPTLGNVKNVSLVDRTVIDLIAGAAVLGVPSFEVDSKYVLLIAIRSKIVRRRAQFLRLRPLFVPTSISSLSSASRERSLQLFIKLVIGLFFRLILPDSVLFLLEYCLKGILRKKIK
jgi:hypothetical protein